MERSPDTLTIQVDTDKAVPLITRLLTSVGLHVIQSFNLQTVRSKREYGSCSHHENEVCNCQMAVLLIYGLESTPITLIAQGHDGKTYLSLIGLPQERTERVIFDMVREALLA